jgi:hypothetical protein
MALLIALPFLMLMMAQVCAAPSCANGDVCVAGSTSASGAATCRVWDAETQTWVEDWSDGPGQTHHRARNYEAWLHEWMLPAGGVMHAQFADANLDALVAYGGERDPAIWTGAYLAAQALRYMTTGSTAARRHMEETVTTLHRWWRIAGDRGYLARYAAPAESISQLPGVFDSNTSEVHLRTSFEGKDWLWRSHVSRDQYQGVLLGYSLAYEATDDPGLKESIRDDVVDFAEQLMERKRIPVTLAIEGRPVKTVTLDVQHVVYTDDETPDGLPILDFQLQPLDVTVRGGTVFWSNPAEYLRQIPGLEWLPDIPQSTQAIQLAAAFAVALQVTEGIEGYEDRRRALREHYRANVRDWLLLASLWRNTNRCDEGYFGLNIAFMPAFSWARIEDNPLRQWWVRRIILGHRLWREVDDHKNVFFAFLHASQAPSDDALSRMVAEHVEQLDRFQPAPNLAVPIDLRGLYPEDPRCPGISAIAVDVDQRVPATFVWERHPWKLEHPGVPHRVYPGIDYLLAYWLGRYYGFIEDDAPETCLQWDAG